MLKIVIVDDEITALNGISYIIKKHSTDYEITGAFENGEEALNYLHMHHVDVVITDMKMSPIGGLEMIDKIKQINDQIYIVVLSAHSDFDFVRHAMKRGASDYLLKPCQPEDIIDLLKKFQRESDHKIEMVRKRNLVKSFTQVFETGKINNKNIENDVAGIAVLAKDQEYGLKTEKEMLSFLEKYFGQDTVLVPMHNSLIIVIKNRTDITKSYSEIDKYLKANNIFVHVSIIAKEESNGNIVECYELAKNIIEFLRFNNIKGFISFSNYKKHIEAIENIAVSGIIDARILARLIREKNPEELLNKISNAMQVYVNKQKMFNPLQMKKDLIDLIIKTESEFKHVNVTDDTNTIKQSIKSVQSIGEAENLAALEDIFKTAVFNLYAEANEGNARPRYIIDTIKYIEKHYMEDISVKEVAETLYLNIWHLSAQFKKYTGISMSDYINKVRIEIAKELLQQPDLMVYQVAEMVGFSNATYFSTVFKSIEKITPKKYQIRIRGIQ